MDIPPPTSPSSSPCPPPTPPVLQGVTEDQVYSVWSQSGLEWSTHLHVPPEDVGYLLEDHVSSQYLYYHHTICSSCSSSVRVGGMRVMVGVVGRGGCDKHAWQVAACGIQNISDSSVQVLNWPSNLCYCGSQLSMQQLSPPCQSCLLSLFKYCHLPPCRNSPS